MDCRYFDEGRCRSCTLIKTPHLAQVESKRRRLEILVSEARPGKSDRTVWLEPLVSEESGFRSKAKMVVGGTVDEPTVGILDPDDRGVDLRLCPLYTSDLARAFPILAEFITVARLEPYDIPARKGELKHIIVTVWPSAGYAYMILDTRGHGSQWGSGGDTPDPVGSTAAAPGYVTRGILDPEDYYFRRVITDAVLAADRRALSRESMRHGLRSRVALKGGGAHQLALQLAFMSEVLG